MDTAQKLAFITQFLDALNDTQAEIGHSLTPVDQFFMAKIDEWAGKIMGVSSGYEAEFKQLYKHRVLKRRQVMSGHADVVVGDPDDIHAKSIQLKSTIGDHSQVNSMIKVALNQLSGERGEKPRDRDRMVVDMTIHEAQNTWPGGIGTLGTLDWPSYLRMAGSKIEDLCAADSYRRHKPKEKKEGFGLNPQTRGRLTDVQNAPLTALHQHAFMGHRSSTQLLATQWGKHPSQGEKVIHLAVKIRYTDGYPVINGRNLISGENKYLFLHLVTFNVVRIGDDLSVVPAKAIFFSENGFTKTML